MGFQIQSEEVSKPLRKRQENFEILEITLVSESTYKIKFRRIQGSLIIDILFTDSDIEDREISAGLEVYSIAFHNDFYFLGDQIMSGFYLKHLKGVHTYLYRDTVVLRRNFVCSEIWKFQTDDHSGILDDCVWEEEPVCWRGLDINEIMEALYPYPV